MLGNVFLPASRWPPVWGRVVYLFPPSFVLPLIGFWNVALLTLGQHHFIDLKYEADSFCHWWQSYRTAIWLQFNHWPTWPEGFLNQNQTAESQHCPQPSPVAINGELDGQTEVFTYLGSVQSDGWSLQYLKWCIGPYPQTCSPWTEYVRYISTDLKFQNLQHVFAVLSSLQSWNIHLTWNL